MELAIETADSTKVPDVVWASDATIARRSGEVSWQSAPEICVEVLSPANTVEEMEKNESFISNVAQWKYGFVRGTAL